VSPRRRRVRLLARAGSLCSLALALACAAPEVPAPAAPASEARRPPHDAGFRRVKASGQGLELFLPDADGWQHDAREPRSWVATHAATRSRLVARTWRSDAIAKVAECERQMRAWRPDLPALPPEARLETRKLRLAGDTAAELWSGASRARPASGELFGYAQLVGSDGRHCLYLGYTTSADGDDVTRVIGQRLAVITRVFERVRRLDIGDSVRRR
jgi:hypothetical protein